MINPWFKFYGSEFLSDPKISALTAQERSCWMTLLCLASSSSSPGKIEFLTTEVLLKKSGVEFDPYDTAEWDKCLGVLRVFERMKMITMSDDGVIEISNWVKRQETALTNAERQAKYRENKNSNKKVTDTVTKVTLEEKRIDKNREEKKESSIFYLREIPTYDLEEFYTRFDCSRPAIKDKAESLALWCESKGKKYSNYKSFLLNALKKDFPIRKPVNINTEVKENLGDRSVVLNRYKPDFLKK